MLQQVIEHQHVEWKESWRDEYLKWICGFANADGGVLVIGRNDKGTVVGIENAGRLLVDIPNKVRDILGIMVNVNLRKEAGDEFLEILVEPYPYPVSYRGEYHFRSGSTKQELKGAALDKFLLRKQGRTWDGVPMPHVAIKDLSRPAMDTFRKLARQSRRLDFAVLREKPLGLIEKLHLLDGKYLKRAAVLLFHPDPEHSVARLKAKHPSHPFNPCVANVFFRAGQIEAWGRGIERIFSACTSAGTPPPALRCEQKGLWVDFEFGPAADLISRETGEKTGEKAREKTRDKILGLIRVDPGISMESMAISLGLTRKGVEWQVRKLKQSGILRRVGPDKGGHWEILGMNVTGSGSRHRSSIP
jgi:predicted HTH transcriptional regulator